AHRAGWKNAKHIDQWESTLRTYAGPVIGKRPVDQIVVEDVLRIIKPIWSEKSETASRLRGRTGKRRLTRLKRGRLAWLPQILANAACGRLCGYCRQTADHASISSTMSSNYTGPNSSGASTI
ncbi:MAG: hypothetical protein KKF33_12110, partial [Alphaproteobacteria bacterium]|nr:hypothetical protein [Alphaproteobacteria bacterium]